MAFLVVSFVAGMLTVLAPCILPLLPVVIGSSATGRKLTPYVVVGSLALSIILFTFLLKASTAFITIPPYVWTYVSGGILVLFGLTLVAPALWERLPGLAGMSATSNKLLGRGAQQKSLAGDALVGAALGPVFSTCSPTYFVILASVLPASFALGTLYLLAYVLGLSVVLLLLALLGERLVARLSGFANPRGWFKRGIGALFIVLGLLIATGLEKKIETAILESGWFDVTVIERTLLELTDPMEQESRSDSTPYAEITDPAGFVNTDGITIGELVGKQVVLVDFMTYSCINCQRTFPYLTAWHEKYKDAGLTIVGIHTPEFAFEKDINNVRAAMREFGIEYPVVLDNNYATWRAYGNRYWPRKYLIDIHGNIVYDHIGEGAYEETERVIQELLAERARVLGEAASVPSSVVTVTASQSTARSPETYFGVTRTTLANGIRREGDQTFTLPQSVFPDVLYLSGTWKLADEHAESVSESSVHFVYDAREVYLVAEADTPVTIEVWQDGALVGTAAGADTRDGVVTIGDSRLYKIVTNPQPGRHTLELRVQGPGARIFTFTFG